MEKPRGRPKAIEAKQQYTVMLKPSVVKEVDEYAEKLGLTRSQFMSNLIESALDDTKLFDKSGRYSSDGFLMGEWRREKL